jgi:hypothetical protein
MSELAVHRVSAQTGEPAVLRRRLITIARQAREEAERAQARHLAAEQAIADYDKAKRTQSLTDTHPEGCPSPDLTAAWEPIAQRLRENAEAHVWTTWLRWVHPHGVHNGTWVLTCPPPVECRDWMQERFAWLFEWACGKPARLVVCDLDAASASAHLRGQPKEIVACGCKSADAKAA